MTKIEETKRKRSQFLQKLYELTGRHESEMVLTSQIGEKLGFNKSVTRKIAQSLREMEFINILSYSGMISITHCGILEVERILSEPDKPTNYPAPVNIISVGQMRDSQIQQAGSEAVQLDIVSDDNYGQPEEKMTAGGEDKITRPIELKTPRSEQIEEIYDFWNMVHKDIITVARSKFEDGYYADAVESALKEINKRVKGIVIYKTGEEMDGASLMHKAFSEKNPIIVLDDLSSESGRNIQKGYMQIFAGVITGIRNPKAHDNIIISKERAVHFLFLASLLMYKLDEAIC